jgi:hypothetical protein
MRRSMSPEEGEWELRDLKPIDPLEISEAYMDRAVEAYEQGAAMDSLIYTRISQEHIIGPYAPRHRLIDPEEYPMRRTFPS